MEERKPATATPSTKVSALPTDEQLLHWTMRNNSHDFDAEEALASYMRNEDQFNAADDEFLKNF